MIQHEITSPHPLLDEHGNLIESGWANRLLLEYDRAKIKAGKFRIKEWDLYEIHNPDYGVILLIYDVGYLANAQVTWLNFRERTEEAITESIWFSRGKMNLPPNINRGAINFSQNGALWECVIDERTLTRHINFNFPKFREGKGISGELLVYEPEGMDHMVNVIPFKKKHQFVYVQKSACMPAVGKVTVAGSEFKFSESNESYGCIDWSRAVFPYHCEWRWCIASGKIDGIPFGFNIDYGFGTESSKNMLFYNYKGHHLDEVTYTFNDQNPLEDWIITSNDSRVNLILHPFQLGREKMNYIILRSSGLKVYGFFTGEVILDNGRRIEITKEERIFGSAEAVINYW